MSLYVFDTDILSLLMKDRLPAHALDRVEAVPAERAATTAITLGELHFGALRSTATARWLTAIARVTTRLECLPFDEQAALHYAEIRVHLEAKGTRLDDPDLRIASICRATDRTLVSGNERHFSRVPGLRYENWLRKPRTPGR